MNREKCKNHSKIAVLGLLLKSIWSFMYGVRLPTSILSSLFSLLSKGSMLCEIRPRIKSHQKGLFPKIYLFVIISMCVCVYMCIYTYSYQPLPYTDSVQLYNCSAPYTFKTL